MMELATHYILLYLYRDLQSSSVSVDLFKQLVLVSSYHCKCVGFFFLSLFSFKNTVVLCFLHQTKLVSIQKLLNMHVFLYMWDERSTEYNKE